MSNEPVVSHPIALEWLAPTCELAIVRLDPRAPEPRWLDGWSFVSVTRTDRELSIIAPIDAVPAGVRREGPYVAARVRGELPCTLVGVFTRILGPLAAAGIPILALSTFETDYVLVRSADRERAEAAWRGAGIECR
ncbi:MAG: ACT domain-containing protein [Phycisphaerales bacterium]